MTEHIAVLGAGLAGLAAAQRARELGIPTDIYEQKAHVGGHAASHDVEGFIFDEGPHVSFTKRDQIKDRFAAATGGEYLEHESLITNYWRGRIIRHPAQTNLHGLPPDVVERCIVDFAEATKQEDVPPATYADWCLSGLGRAFSEEFTFRYTRKYWTTDASNMSTEWVGARMYRPSLQEVVRGALTDNREQHHYLTNFRYPLHGGFATYVKAVSAGQTVHTDHEVAVVDLQRRELEFLNGRKAHFGTLISSLPVPELIRRIRDVPERVLEASEKLVCTSVVIVNIGLPRDEGFPDVHWMYFYDEETIFARGNLPHRLSPNNVPAGCGSIQLEVYHSRYKPLPCDDVLSRTIDDLVREGLLERNEKMLVAQEQRIPYANVLFDLERTRNLAIVNEYLEANGVLGCGRYGEWAYLWTDDSVVSGWAAAERAASRTAAVRGS